MKVQATRGKRKKLTVEEVGRRLLRMTTRGWFRPFWVAAGVAVLGGVVQRWAADWWWLPLTAGSVAGPAVYLLGARAAGPWQRLLIAVVPSVLDDGRKGVLDRPTERGYLAVLVLAVTGWLSWLARNGWTSATFWVFVVTMLVSAAPWWWHRRIRKSVNRYVRAHTVLSTKIKGYHGSSATLVSTSKSVTVLRVRLEAGKTIEDVGTEGISVASAYGLRPGAVTISGDPKSARMVHHRIVPRNPWKDRIPHPMPAVGELTYEDHPLVTMGILDDATEQQVDPLQMLGAVGRRGSGKALALDTPVPTPSGWTTMGELRDGDELFAESGAVCRVVRAHPVRHDRPCYEVVFSSGEVIVADADHLWWTEDLAARKSRKAISRRPIRKERAGRISAAKRAELLAWAHSSTDLLTTTQARERTGLTHDQIRTAAFPLEPAGLVATARRPQPGYHARALVDSLIRIDDLPDGRDQRGKRISGKVRTTEEIRSTLKTSTARGESNHSIPVTAPLQCAEVPLLVHPYVLGAWLGDGTSATAAITCADDEIIDRIRATGQPARAAGRYLWRLSDGVRHGRGPGAELTLQARLRRLGVLNNKHVPAVYLRASEGQRRELLAGLLDTDGTVAPRGTVEFTSTNGTLAAGVHELACSLGFRATMREGVARLHGCDIGPKWTVAFTTNQQVFGLTRKNAALAERTIRHNPDAVAQRYIVDVRPIESRPVRCITVDSPSSLFLVGRSMIATHNSTLLESSVIWDTGYRNVAVLGTDLAGGATLGVFEPLMCCPLATTLDDAQAQMRGLFALGEYRERKLAAEKRRDPSYGNLLRITADDPVVIWYVDELPELVKAGGKGVITLLTRIAAKFRKVRIVPKVAGQNPTEDDFGSTEFRAQIENLFGLLLDRRQSTTLWGADQKMGWDSTILGRGQHLLRSDSVKEPRIAQGFYVTDAQKATRMREMRAAVREGWGRLPGPSLALLTGTEVSPALGADAVGPRLAVVRDPRPEAWKAEADGLAERVWAILPEPGPAGRRMAWLLAQLNDPDQNDGADPVSRDQVNRALAKLRQDGRARTPERGQWCRA